MAGTKRWRPKGAEINRLMAIRIFLVDDYELILAALAALLERHTTYTIAGTATNGADAIPLICRENPDVIIMDAVMPQMDGSEATRLLLQQRPHSRVIMLAPNSSPRLVAQAMVAGARGYVDQSKDKRFLFEAIRVVNDGGAYFPAEASPSGSQVARMIYQSSKQTNLLSERERQVLAMVVNGASSREIGERLHLSVHTVDTYRSRIRTKMGAETMAELVKIAIRQGLVAG